MCGEEAGKLRWTWPHKIISLLSVLLLVLISSGLSSSHTTSTCQIQFSDPQRSKLYTNKLGHVTFPQSHLIYQHSQFLQTHKNKTSSLSSTPINPSLHFHNSSIPAKGCFTMLTVKGSFNAGVEKIQPLTKSRNLGNGSIGFKPSSVVSYSGFCRSGSGLGSIKAVLDNKAAATTGAIEGVNGATLADRLRLGSLTDDRLSYKERFIVRCYEVGINKTATVETMANLLQEVGCNHAQSVGFSTDGFATTTSMRKMHLIWVTARMHIEIYKYPAWSDVVEIETWCQGEGRIGTRRDWILKDYANGEVIGRATSKWVMMNMDTRRLQKVTDDVRDEVLVHCPKELRLSFPEENNNSLKKIPKLENPAYVREGLMPRRADLDMNRHVNNVAYIGWVLESMPEEIIDTHELHSITLDYRRECQRDDVVDSLTSPEIDFEEGNHGTNGSAMKSSEQDFPSFLHFLRLSPSGHEINRGRTEWRKKSPK